MVSAITDATKLTVNLSTSVPADVKVDDKDFTVKVNGEEVDFTVGNGATDKEYLVTLTKALKDGDKVTVEGKDDLQGSAEQTYTVPVVVTSISEITETTVTVTVKDKHAADLTATKFSVSGATVTKVAKGSSDYEYILTVNSLANSKGTVKVGEISRDFDFTKLKVASVTAPNLRELVVTFNQEVDEDSAEELHNYFYQLVDETTGAINTRSLKTLDSAFSAVLGKDKKTVTISASNGSLITDFGLKLNEAYNIQVRNVKTAAGDYTSVQEAGEILRDTVKPVVSIDKTGWTSSGKLPIGTNLKLAFSEPVAALEATTTSFSAGVQVYIDNVLVDQSQANNLIDVVTTGTVAQNKAVTINTSGLTKGTHTVSIVGVKDLAGNVIEGNPVTFTFEVSDGDVTDTVKPHVVSTRQIADNAFVVRYNTTGVEPKASSTFLTLKEAAYNSSTGKYEDIVLKASASGAITAEATVNGSTPTSISAGFAFEAVDVDTNGDGIVDATEWKVVLPATLTSAAAELSFREAAVISKQLVINNYHNIGELLTTANRSNSNEKAGDEYVATLQLQRDTKAPVVKDQTKDVKVDVNKGQILVKFTDDIFTTDGNGKITVGTGGKEVVEVKVTNVQGVTYTANVDASLVTSTENTNHGFNLSADELGRTLLIDLNDLNADDTRSDAATDLLDNGKLIDGAIYSVKFQDGAVTDNIAEAVTTANVNFQGATSTTPVLENVTGANPLVGFTLPVNVKAGSVATGAPQTTKGLISSYSEIVADAAGAPGARTTYATAVKAILDLNQASTNQIVVEFVGDVDAKTVKNLNNFTLNGKAMPNGTTVEYVIPTSGALTGKKLAVVTLPSDSVALNGAYEFRVSGIADSKLNTMLPVVDTVALRDNTAPVAQKVETVNSNTIRLVFSENITVTNATKVLNNFAITANNKNLAVTSATVQNGKELVLVLSQDYASSVDELNAAKVSVQIKKDSNADIFIVDPASNKAATVTVSR